MKNKYFKWIKLKKENKQLRLNIGLDLRLDCDIRLINRDLETYLSWFTRPAAQLWENL